MVGDVREIGHKGKAEERRAETWSQGNQRHRRRHERDIPRRESETERVENNDTIRCKHTNTERHIMSEQAHDKAATASYLHALTVQRFAHY